MNMPATELIDWALKRYTEASANRHLFFLSSVFQRAMNVFHNTKCGKRTFSLAVLAEAARHRSVRDAMMDDGKRACRAYDRLMMFSAESELKAGKAAPEWETAMVQIDRNRYKQWLRARYSIYTAYRYVQVIDTFASRIMPGNSLFEPQRACAILRALMNVNTDELAEIAAREQLYFAPDTLDVFKSYVAWLVARWMRQRSTAADAEQPVVSVPDGLEESPDDLPELHKTQYVESGFKAWLEKKVSLPQTRQKYLNIVREAGEYLQEHFGCRPLVSAASPMECRRRIALLREDKTACERFMSKRQIARVFDMFVEYAEQCYELERRNRYAVSLKEFGDTDALLDVPVNFSIEGFAVWAQTEVSYLSRNLYVRLIQETPQIGGGVYSGLLHARTLREAADLVEALSVDREFVSTRRVSKSNALKCLLKYYVTLASGACTVMKDGRLLREVPKAWQDYAAWMRARMYTEKHIAHTVFTLQRVEKVLQENGIHTPLSQCRNGELLAVVRERKLEEVSNFKRCNFMLTLNKFFYYVEDRFGGKFMPHEPLYMGSYANVTRRFREWLLTSGIKPKSDRNYVTGVRDLGECLGDPELFFRVETLDEAIALIRRCRETDVYNGWDTRSSTREFAKQSYNWYIDFLTAHKLLPSKVMLAKLRDLKPMLSELILRCFNGVVLGDGRTICNEIRACWETYYKGDCPPEPDDLQKALKDIAVALPRVGYYLPEFILPDSTLELMNDNVRAYREAGVFGVSYKALMKGLWPTTQPEWKGCRNDADRERLFALALKHRMPKSYDYKTRNARFLPDADESSEPSASFAQKLCEFVKKQKRKVSLKKIQKQFPNVDPNAISRLCYASSGPVADYLLNVKPKFFLHIDSVQMPEEAWQAFVSKLDERVSYKGKVRKAEIAALAEKCMPGIFSNAECALSPASFFAYVRRRLADRFSFEFSSIVAPEVKVPQPIVELCRECAKLGNTFTARALKKLQLRCRCYRHRPWKYLFEQVARVSAKHFVPRESVHFDVEATDKKLESVCKDVVVPLRSIRFDASWPVASHTWNTFLLEFYLCFCSKKFRLEHMRFGHEPYGMVVSHDGPADFHSAAAAYLVEHNVALEPDTVLAFMNRKGIFDFKKYHFLNRIIDIARKLRKKKS